MKKSLSHLPKDKRRELTTIANRILERLPETQMIILYGSYARGDYVEYDRRVEFGVTTEYMSDFDLLVVTHDAKLERTRDILIGVEEWYHCRRENGAALQIIFEEIETLNRQISDRRYFYTDIKKEGIMLYDTEKFKLARRRKLRFDEIKEQAQEYYEERYQSAVEFLGTAKWTYNQEWYNKSIFNLHQATENAFKAVRLTHTLYSGKLHNLTRLIRIVKKYSPDGYSSIFPRQTAEEKRLFALLQAAYIEARYNSKFVVTKEDIDALTPSIERLLDLTKRLCEERIKEYENMINTFE